MAENRALFGVNANVFLFGVVSFFTDMSSEIITPILPFFIEELMGKDPAAGIGAGVVIGLIGGLSDSISSILNVFSGYFSDKTGKRKAFVFSGYGLSSLAKVGMAFSTTWLHVLIAKPLERVGKGLRNAPRDAIIAEAKKEVRGKSFGIQRAMDSAGAIMGVIIALALTSYGIAYSSMILLAGGIGFIALIPIFFVSEKGTEKKGLTLKVGLSALPRNFRLFGLIVTLFALGNFNIMFFILKAGEASSLSELPLFGSGVAVAILLYLWFNVINTLLSVPVGILSDRVGRKKVLVAGYLLFSASCLGFAYLQDFLSLLVFFGIYGVFMAFVDGTQRAYASDLISPDLRGTALGTFHTATALATLPASVVAGYLWDYVGHETTFLYGAAIGLLASMLFLAVHMKD